MRTGPTFRLIAYSMTVVAGLAASLLLGRPDPAVLAAPFATFVVIALLDAAPTVPRLRVRAESERVIEGDEVTVDVTLTPVAGEVVPQLPRGVELREMRTTGGGVAIRLGFDSWGVYDVGHFAVRAYDRHRCFATTATLHAPLKVRVYPHPDRLPDHLVAAKDLQPFVGQHASRARGEGFEFADVRPYRVGDRARSVNWRATARRDALWVNERHPERTTSVVVMLDTFGVERSGRQATLDASVRTIAAIAEGYGRSADRIGLLTFGGHLRWVEPSGGRRQVMKIVDALLDTESLLTETWAGVLRVPVGAIPPRSLLLAVTPLDNDTAVGTLIDLRGRGFDVAVLATGHTDSDGDPSRPDLTTEGLGRRLDVLLRDTRRLKLERLGIVVSAFGSSVAASLHEIDERRRLLARVRV